MRARASEGMALPSLFQKVLLATDGSVTELLSIYTGNEIKVQKVDQYISAVGGSAALGCPDGTPLLHRKILLVDEASSHVYAESIFVFERLSRRTQVWLLETDLPIGQLWKEEKAEMHREVIDVRQEQCPAVAECFGLPADTALW